MVEQPSLSLIKEISGNDIAFQNSILDIIKVEFKEEVILFQNNFKAKKYTESAYNVHKIKHKINLLGLEKSGEVATKFETALKNKDVLLYNDFLAILNKIHVYLYD